MGVPLGKSVLFALRHLSVELIVFLVYLGYVFGNIFQSPAIYHKDADLEIDVQQRNAEWSLFNGLAYLTPAIFADTVLGAYGDKFGWKTPLMLGIGGVTIVEFGYLLTLSSSVATPYWTTPLFGFAAGLTGSMSIIPVACYAFLAEITEDSDLLTVRAALFSVFQTLASVLGGFSAAFLYQRLSVIVAMDIELSLYLFALLVALWRLPQRTKKETIPVPPVEDKGSTGSEGSSSTLSPPRPPPIGQRVRGFFAEIKELLQNGVRTYTRRRVGNRRCFLLVTCGCLVLAHTTIIETTSSGVINSYVFRRTGIDHLAWESDDLGFWNGSGYLILAIGTLAGTWIMKRLGCRETTLMLIGIASSGARVLLIGFGSSDLVMYLANGCGIFAGLVQPAGVSFVVQLVAPSEVGRAFSLMGIGGDVAYLVVSATYALVYRFSVEFEAGTVFFLIASIHVLALAALTWVHVQSKRDGVGRRRFTSNLTNAISRIGSPSVEDVREMEGAMSWRGRKGRSRDSVADVAFPAWTLERSQSANGRGQLQKGLWESEEDLRGARGHKQLY